MPKKKNKMNWQRNLPLSTDKSILNTAHWFVPEDFVFSINHPRYYRELCCNYLNLIRIEYITLRNNGEPRSSYKDRPEVADKINAKKEYRLSKKLLKATKFMEYNGMTLRDGFDPAYLNPKPKFTYGDMKERVTEETLRSLTDTINSAFTVQKFKNVYLWANQGTIDSLVDLGAHIEYRDGVKYLNGASIMVNEELDYGLIQMGGE